MAPRRDEQGAATCLIATCLIRQVSCEQGRLEKERRELRAGIRQSQEERCVEVALQRSPEAPTTPHQYPLLRLTSAPLW